MWNFFFHESLLQMRNRCVYIHTINVYRYYNVLRTILSLTTSNSTNLFCIGSSFWDHDIQSFHYSKLSTFFLFDGHHYHWHNYRAGPCWDLASTPSTPPNVFQPLDMISFKPFFNFTNIIITSHINTYRSF